MKKHKAKPATLKQVMKAWKVSKADLKRLNKLIKELTPKPSPLDDMIK